MASIGQILDIDSMKYSIVDDDQFVTHPENDKYFRITNYRFDLTDETCWEEDMENSFTKDALDFCKPTNGWFFVDDDLEYVKAFGYFYNKKLLPWPIIVRIKRDQPKVIEIIFDGNKDDSNFGDIKISDAPGYIRSQKDSTSGITIYFFLRGLIIIPRHQE